MLIHKSEKIKLLSCMIGKKLFPFRLAYINERKKKKVFKGFCLMGNCFWSTLFAGFLQLR